MYWGVGFVSVGIYQCYFVFIPLSPNIYIQILQTDLYMFP